jgi:nucleotide-binding universal stress UspA family protein
MAGIAMQQNTRVLIGIDGSDSAKGAVAYAAKFYDPRQTRVMLMHVEETISYDGMAPEDAGSAASKTIDVKAVRERVMEGARKIMAEAAHILKNNGFSDDAVEIRIQQRERGVARDLMTEAQNGYNAVLVGRRGLNEPTDIIVGSTAYRLVSGIDYPPVVVVGDQPDPGNVLIGFDGSDDAFKGIACAARLMYRPNRRIVLCHVVRSMTHSPDGQAVLTPEEQDEWIEANRRRIETVLTQARERLLAAGFTEDSIIVEMPEGRISRAVSITRAAEKNGCGTIVVGRRGLTMIKDFLMGRVSMKILHRAHKMAVWIA